MNVVRWIKKIADKFKGRDNSKIKTYPLVVPAQKEKKITERRRWTRRQWLKRKRKRKIESNSRKFNLMKA